MQSNHPRITGPTLKILKAFFDLPSHSISGAEIIRSTGIPSGTLYPILFRLERHNWLTSRWEEKEPAETGRPRRRLYQLTALGETASRSAFREHVPNMDELGWQF